MFYDADPSAALTYLTRIAGRKEHARSWLTRSLEGQRFEELVELALEVAIETGDPIGRVLANRLEEAPPSAPHAALLQRLLDKLPDLPRSGG